MSDPTMTKYCAQLERARKAIQTASDLMDGDEGLTGGAESACIAALASVDAMQSAEEDYRFWRLSQRVEA